MSSAPLPPAWTAAVARVRSASRSPIYMPAALLIALDLIEEGEALTPEVEFSQLDERFSALIGPIYPAGKDRAWSPFFHLSTKAGIWDLFFDDISADFSDLPLEPNRTEPRPKSRSRLVERANRARFVDVLWAELQQPGVVQAVRAWAYAELKRGSEGGKLAQAHRTHQRRAPPQRPPLLEGHLKTVHVNRYERSATARQECIDHYGAACMVCRFDFGAVYGELGEGFIHVHHIVPLSQIKKTYEVVPERDLRPVCPNCHAMIHKRKPCLTIDQARKLLRSSQQA